MNRDTFCILLTTLLCVFELQVRNSILLHLFKNVSFGIHPSSRICLVGPNGAGKSTLIKLVCGENGPTEGTVSTRSGLSIGRFHQHSAEILDFDKSPVEYIQSKYQ